MRPLLRLLSCFGFFPSLLPRAGYCSRVRSRNLNAFHWWCISIGGLILCGALFGFNLYIVNLMHTYLGLLHVDTMTSILTGCKPLQSFVALAVFTLGVQEHKRFLRELNTINACFRMHFGISQKTSSSFFAILIMTIFAGAIPFASRLVQYVLGEEVFGESWFADISAALVAIMTCWQYLPLFYYVYINRLLQFWFAELDCRLQHDMRLIRYNIEFYYRYSGIQ